MKRRTSRTRRAGFNGPREDDITSFTVPAKDYKIFYVAHQMGQGYEVVPNPDAIDQPAEFWIGNPGSNDVLFTFPERGGLMAHNVTGGQRDAGWRGDGAGWRGGDERITFVTHRTSTERLLAELREYRDEPGYNRLWITPRIFVGVTPGLVQELQVWLDTLLEQGILIYGPRQFSPFKGLPGPSGARPGLAGLGTFEPDGTLLIPRSQYHLQWDLGINDPTYAFNHECWWLDMRVTTKVPREASYWISSEWVRGRLVEHFAQWPCIGFRCECLHGTGPHRGRYGFFFHAEIAAVKRQLMSTGYYFQVWMELEDAPAARGTMFLEPQAMQELLVWLDLLEERG